MEIYLVGGAVRDQVMGVPSLDRDWVVVGSTPEQMETQGYRPVGKDFPIYLHPLTKEEYALARRERNGNVTVFSPDVTLEEDLAKRDLTINAMAMELFDLDKPTASYRVIDPHFGHDDILNKVLRMVSYDAFWEDPIRVLRVARFAARYPDFRIDCGTMLAMEELADKGKLDNLAPERVWKELSRGLMEIKPSRMLQVLRECGALKVILPEVDALYGVIQPEQWHPEIDTGVHVEQVLDYAASQNFELPVRWACLLHDLGKALSPKDTLPAHHGHEYEGVHLALNVCERLNVPTRIAQVAITTTREHGNIHGAMKLRHTSITKILRKCDAFRNPDRFQHILQACLCDARGRHSDTKSFADVEYPQAQRLSNALWVARQVKGDLVAERCKGRPQNIALEMHATRARAIKAFERNQK